MSALNGRLEAEFSVTSQSQDFVNAAGTTTVTFDGSYFFGDFLSSLQSQLGGGWSVTWSSGEGPLSTITGKITIDSASHHPFHVTWTSTQIRDLLGYTGNISATSSPSTAQAHVLGAWLPCMPKFTRHGDYDLGTPMTDFRQTVGPTGVVYALKSNSYDYADGIKWEGIAGQRVRRHLEVAGNESFESFLRNCQFGENSMFSVGASVRMLWSADEPADYLAGNFLHAGTFDPDTLQVGWNGRYSVVLPRLIITGSQVT